VLGPKFDKNGWKFQLHTTLELQEVIATFYTCVYHKHKVLKDTIILEFARALVVESNNQELNWATYALAAHEK
jgi:hypothetical protein